MEITTLPIGFIGAAEDPGFWEATKGKGAYTIVTVSKTGCTPSNVTPLTMKYYSAFRKKWGVPPRSTGCVSAYHHYSMVNDQPIPTINSQRSISNDRHSGCMGNEH